MKSRATVWPRLMFCAVLIPALLGSVPCGSAPAAAGDEPQAPGRIMARQAVKTQAGWSTTDHSKLPALQKVFKSGPEITAACVSCHSQAEEQFKQTVHWTWIGHVDEKGKRLGKAGDSLNNFCLSSNNMQDKSCSDCHTGWQAKEQGVNCLLCHSRRMINWSEAFEDYNAFSCSNDPEEKELGAKLQADIQASAQAIGLPTRKNCGECHFKGGGGDGVKHGDLDTSLTRPAKTLDVHMAAEGRNFDCTRCHTTVEHRVAGRIYTQPAFEERTSLVQNDLAAKISCESCHGSAPHKPGHKANDHVDKVACQSCHIPAFARQLPTKMAWDWSQAGRLKDGQKYKEEGPLGKEIYMSIKGVFQWEKNVRPQYRWFNGSMHTLTVKDRIDPAAVVPVSEPVGGPGDGRSRIFPFKVHLGRQPYDKVNKNLVAPILSGEHGYWTTLDWKDSLERGMQALNVPFSGEYDFVQSTYFFPTTHMVAPKENAVACSECHVRGQSRLAGVAGVYMPARDRSGPLDALGWLAACAALLGVMVHAGLRLFAPPRKE